MSIEDFIYFKNERFNSCEFCQQFGLNENCPVKAFYVTGEDFDEEKINEGIEKCKNYVITELKKLLNEKK